MRKDWKYRRGDIYFADLGEGFGSEQGGIRPVVVVQNNVGNAYAPTISVAPITSNIKKPKQPTHHVFNLPSILKAPSMVMAEQTNTIDKKRILSYAGKLDAANMRAVEKAVRIHFGFEVPDE